MPRGTRRPAARRALAHVTGDVRYEVLPLAGAVEEARWLPPGSAVTVTCSPAKGIDATVAVAAELAALDLRVIPHLAARRVRDEVHLKAIVEQLDEAGIHDALVLGGDGGPDGDYASGLELLGSLADLGALDGPLRGVGVPGYPEGHHLIDDEVLWQALAAKQPYATEIVTQLCFHSALVCDWVRRARAQGITLPVIAGVPGVVDPGKLLRISTRIGIGDSLRFVRGNTSVLARFLRPGGYKPDALIRGLSARVREQGCDLSGLHVYTFNHVGPTVKRVEALRRRAVVDGRGGAP